MWHIFQKNQFIENVTAYTREGIPFFLLIDFEIEQYGLWKLEELDGAGIRVSFPDYTNTDDDCVHADKIHIKPGHLPYSMYEKAFTQVMHHLLRGDTYLLNLTFSVPVETECSLKEIYQCARSRYKIFVENRFVCFSPETFIRIVHDHIFTYPMKGTIDATLPDAEKLLLDDEKELAEHYTVVDLLRNDIGMISEDVEVRRFRYIDRIVTNRGELLQTSSEIAGRLPYNWREHFGSMLLKLLPAGSVSGAPKKKTCEIIRNVEQRKRGFYTGVALLYDGSMVDSCVLIRFIEATSNGYVYHAGGGITTRSKCIDEYQELLNKVYVPVF